MDLPKWLLHQIASHLSIVDIGNIKQVNSKLNVALSDNVFWRHRLKQDFDFDTWIDTCYALYQNLYLGEQVLSNNQIYDWETFKFQETGLVNNGFIAVYVNSNQPFHIQYKENWSDMLAYCKIRRSEANMCDNRDQMLLFYTPVDLADLIIFDNVVKPSHIFYVAPNQISNWNLKFHRNGTYVPLIFESYRKMVFNARIKRRIQAHI